jgi:hypothetical protein
LMMLEVKVVLTYLSSSCFLKTESLYYVLE